MKAISPRMRVFEFGLTDGRIGYVELDFDKGYCICFEQYLVGYYKTEEQALEVLNGMKFEPSKGERI